MTHYIADVAVFGYMGGADGVVNMPEHTVKIQNRYIRALYLSAGFGDFGEAIIR